MESNSTISRSSSRSSSSSTTTTTNNNNSNNNNRQLGATQTAGRRIAVLQSHLRGPSPRAVAGDVDAAAEEGAAADDDVASGCSDGDYNESTTAGAGWAGAAAADGRAADPNPRAQRTKWNGWGFADTEFYANADGQVCLSGTRYAECFERERVMPQFRSWIEDTFKGFNFLDQTPANPQPFTPPPPRPCEALATALAAATATAAAAAAGDGPGPLHLHTGNAERVAHGHGCTNAEVYALRWGALARVPDAVCYPRSHQEVELLVALAARHGVCLIPFGGGTSVTEALLCPDTETEPRPIVSVDLRRHMHRVVWVDVDSMLACVEAGAVGVHLDEDLAARGLCLGHEPDSREFSTVGGWVATRASGMKKNTYGNIEDVVVDVKVVTPAGTLDRSGGGGGGGGARGGLGAPRRSTGPDVVQMVIGSEGMLGVVTEVVVRLQPLPETTVYDSALFPDFATGVAALREVALHRLQPTSIRLMDNPQFRFGQVLKPAPGGSAAVAAMGDAAKKFYVQRVRGFDLEKAAAASLLFEGPRARVAAQRRDVARILRKHGGLMTGAEGGRRGYFLTYMIAYLRDFGYNFWFMAESFETSVAWKHVSDLCANVKLRLARSCREHGVRHPPFVSCRISQSYDTGACVYFYFAIYERVEADARDEVLRHGGTLSHHHGVGKVRRRWMRQVTGDTGMLMLRALKEKLDPDNIFCAHNLGL